MFQLRPLTGIAQFGLMQKTNKPYTTTCYHEMVVVKDQDGKMGYRIVFYIPDREYDLTHGGDISRQLTNGLDMGDYSGFKKFIPIQRDNLQG